MTLDDIIAATSDMPAHAPLVFATEYGPIGEGYHVTELKLAQISSIDCGAHTDAWTETTLQLLDGGGKSHMPVGKFTDIVKQSIRRIEHLGDSALRVEFAHGNDGLRIFEPTLPRLIDGRVVLELHSIHAQCKPAAAGRLSDKDDSCCTGKTTACCA